MPSGEASAVRTDSFAVRGMDCSAEEQLVRMALATCGGVRAVQVDLVERTVRVTHDGDLAAVDAALGRLELGSSHLGEVDTPPDADADAGDEAAERRGLVLALGVNATLLVVELVAGLIAGSLGLLADALDMGADASVYAVALLAVGGAASRKLRVARWSGGLQLALAALGLAEVLRRFLGTESLPDPAVMVVVSVLALLGNAVTLVVLHRIRSQDPHIRASWIFTANDVVVNMLVIVAAVAVAVLDSAIPDLVVGLVIFGVVANGARRILRLQPAG